MKWLLQNKLLFSAEKRFIQIPLPQYSKYQIDKKILPDDFSPTAVLYAEYGSQKGLSK